MRERREERLAKKPCRQTLLPRCQVPEGGAWACRCVCIVRCVAHVEGAQGGEAGEKGGCVCEGGAWACRCVRIVVCVACVEEAQGGECHR